MLYFHNLIYFFIMDIKLLSVQHCCSTQVVKSLGVIVLSSFNTKVSFYKYLSKYKHTVITPKKLAL